MPAASLRAHVAEPQRRAVDEHLPRVGRDRAGQHLDERRFPRAVFAAQRVHFAARDAQAHAGQRLHAAVRLADLADFDEVSNRWTCARDATRCRR